MDAAVWDDRSICVDFARTIPVQHESITEEEVISTPLSARVYSSVCMFQVEHFTKVGSLEEPKCALYRDGLKRTARGRQE